MRDGLSLLLMDDDCDDEEICLLAAHGDISIYCYLLLLSTYATNITSFPLLLQ